MRVYWLPYAKVSDGHHGTGGVRFAKADFVLENGDVWPNRLGVPRPEWLSIFRQFAPDASSQPEPVNGTLVLSDDPSWLEDNIDTLIGVVYYLGTRLEPVPAEKLKYVPLTIRHSGDGLVCLWHKNGALLEDVDSLALQPPLVLRGISQRHVVTEDRDAFECLERLLDTEPMHRLLVACRHFFRAQFTDPFVSPCVADVVLYCSVLEAVLGTAPNETSSANGSLDEEAPGDGRWVRGLSGLRRSFRELLLRVLCQERARHFRRCLVSRPRRPAHIPSRTVSSHLSERLQRILFRHRDLPRWVSGLYAERSVYVHGISEAEDPGKYRNAVRDLEFFRKFKGNETALYLTCRYLLDREIRLQKGDNEEDWLLRGFEHRGRRVLDFLLFSFARWQAFKKVVTRSQSILLLTSEAENGTLPSQVLTEFVQGVYWPFITDQVGGSAIVGGLRVVLSAIANLRRTTLTRTVGTVPSDAQEAIAWQHGNADWQDDYPCDSPEVLMKAVAFKLSEYWTSQP